MDVAYQSFTSDRRFGVELEVNRKLSREKLAEVVKSCGKQVTVEGWNYTTNNAHWVVKTDSTCGDQGNKDLDGGGFEVVSPADKGPMHLINIAAVTEKIRDAGAVVNQYCGLHCQVEIKDFALSDLSTLLARWTQIENVVTNMENAYRISASGSKYCKLFWKKYPFEEEKKYTWEEFFGIVRPKKLDPTGKRTSITAINYLRSTSGSYEWAHFDRRTVELRLPCGTLDPEDVKNWARFFIHFVETSKGKEFPGVVSPVKLKESLTIMGLHSDDPFYILSPGLYETKLWILKRIIRFGRSKKLIADALKMLDKMTEEGIRIPRRSTYEGVKIKVKKKKLKSNVA